VASRCDVGGVLLERPFKIRRLGHFGFDVADVDAALRFYGELLGFEVSDSLDFARIFPRPELFAGAGSSVGYFMRHAGDHHSFVLFPRRVRELMREALRAGGPAPPPDISINQITWQVGSLAEVVNAVAWLAERGVPIVRSGRDVPGSNWHTYPVDPDGHTHELYYGIEQIGWDGRSKPRALHGRQFRETPGLPQPCEHDEVDEARARGVDLASGHRHEQSSRERFDVGGVLLPRPFKVVRIGPVRLFTRDLEAARRFACERLGLTQTEEALWRGHRCLFLRAGTEHHSLALYPQALRAELGLSPHTTCLSFGLQIADYRQLRAAVEFLEKRGVRIAELPAELSPGIDHQVLAFDPDGHALQLYFQMEQIGWDGRPRPWSQRAPLPRSAWPEALEPRSDTFAGEPFLGPWG
jgi:catechol 2,3-dioxygenase-like lactoylglutathione lyase family enzyme